MRKLITIFGEIVIITLGCALYALGFTVFIYPNHISPGGVTGISTIINQFFAFLPIGLMIIIINLPLIVVGFIKFKLAFVLKTAYATFLSSLLIDILPTFLPIYNKDRLLASLVAGVLIGAGLGVIMLKGGSTGGTDIVAKLINTKYPFLSLGRLILFVDAVIVAIAAISYGDFESLLYSVLFLFVSGTVMDRLIYGADNGKIVYIMSEKTDDITNEIFRLVGRGVTKINAVGGYSGKSQNMLMCVARVHEVSKIIQIIRDIDASAFTVISDAGEILGLGFKKIK